MQTLIAYSSKYGGTKACAERIQAKLPGDALLWNLDTSPTADLAPFDTVILGCSFYMGKPRKAMRKFAKKYEKQLVDKNLGMFLCCIQDIDKNVREQFELAYGKALMQHATALEQLGGLVDFTKLTPVDKMIMNMVAGDLRKKTNSDIISTVKEERIDMFCRQLLGQ